MVSFLSKMNHLKTLSSACLLTLAAASNNVVAEIQPRSASLNYSQKSLSNAGNPAAAAYVIARKDPHVMTGGYIEVNGGVEYGDFDELFLKLDELTALYNPPTEGDDGSDGEEAAPTPGTSERNYIWEDLFYAYPELEDRLDVVKTKVGTAVGFLAVIAAEGYAKAEVSNDMSFVLNEDLYGGTLLFGSTVTFNSKMLGIFDEINFDLDIAKEELRRIPEFTESDAIQMLDLSGGISLYYNPANRKSKITVSNDSLLLVKAAKSAAFSLSYSRHEYSNDSGDLYWGVKPTFYRIGLSNVSARMGELTDTEEFFNDIENADFIYKNGLDLDLGVVWAAEHYQVGTSVKNLVEQTYDFPELESGRITSDIILNQLNKQQTFTMERQIKLEAGIFTAQRQWSLNAEIDANAVEDYMHDEYQWLTLTGGYAADSWWLPSARIGVTRNVAGSELTYVNAGVTVMKFVNIDASTTLNTVSLDGSEIPRGFNVRLGVQFDY